VFECDKCTYRTRLNKNMQDHIKTKHQSMNTEDFEESYNDSTEVYEIQSHIETEDISECKNSICQEIQISVKILTHVSVNWTHSCDLAMIWLHCLISQEWLRFTRERGTGSFSRCVN
jgi:hypothetical protein